MGGPRDYHTKRSKSERERQVSYDIAYMWNLKYDTNQSIYETEPGAQSIENRFVVAKSVGGKRGLDWEFWINRCKLVYIEWINNKVLQYSSLLLLLSHVRLCATP